MKSCFALKRKLVYISHIGVLIKNAGSTQYIFIDLNYLKNYCTGYIINCIQML